LDIDLYVIWMPRRRRIGWLDYATAGLKSDRQAAGALAPGCACGPIPAFLRRQGTLSRQFDAFRIAKPGFVT
jgi:hypothetical protein